jgi:S-DNA-T family DNA segregation ATPase FtsK/SpoIIIE
VTRDVRSPEDRPPLYDAPDDDAPVEVRVEVQGDVRGDEPEDDAPGQEVAVRGQTAPAEVLDGEVLPPWREPPRAQRVFPAWVIDPRERREAIRWAKAHTFHRAKFHTVRLPIYAARTVVHSPRGLGRAIWGWARWAFDAEGKPLRIHTVERGKVDEYVKLTRIRNDRVKLRLQASSGIALASIAAAGTAWWYWPLTPYALLVAAVTALGYAGRALDRPFIDHAVLPPEVRPLTPDMVITAYAAAGLHKDEAPIEFLQPVQRDGAGYLVVMNLPRGKTAVDALKVRAAIAGGLDKDEVQVFIDPVRGAGGSSRMISMWVADRDPYAQKPPVTPLAKAPRIDFWDGFPFGVDARGRLVRMQLIWSSLLVGAIPRQGKTFAARLAAAAGALDPYVDLVIFNGKGDNAWKAFKQVAYRYGSGIRDSVVEHLVQVLEEAQAEMNRRNEAMEEMPDDVCPDSKLTPAMSRNKALNMRLQLIAIDEIQRYLEHKQHGARILELLIDIAKVGPSTGFMLVLATQRPDSQVIPSDLSGQMGIRFALKVMSYHASNVILGPGASKAGMDSSLLLRQHKGVGILLGTDDGEMAEKGAQTVRSHFADAEVITDICKRGRELRITAGTLAGVAAGEEFVSEMPVRSLLDDVLGVFLPGEDRLWSEAICARLAAEMPGIYDGWDQTDLANALAPYGVDTRQLDMKDPDTGKRKNRRGIDREAVLQAQSRRLNRRR